VNPITRVDELLSGIDLSIENFGTIINENGDRANCDFHFDAVRNLFNQIFFYLLINY
jgi:hypothetical protein